jgi:hypothetical protein
MALPLGWLRHQRALVGFPCRVMKLASTENVFNQKEGESYKQESFLHLKNELKHLDVERNMLTINFERAGVEKTRETHFRRRVCQGYSSGPCVSQIYKKDETTKPPTYFWLGSSNLKVEESAP